MERERGCFFESVAGEFRGGGLRINVIKKQEGGPLDRVAKNIKGDISRLSRERPPILDCRDISEKHPEGKRATYEKSGGCDPISLRLSRSLPWE